MPDRFFDGFLIGVLACLAIVAVGRGAMLAGRGVRLFPIDPERTLPHSLADLGFLLCFALWFYEALAFAFPLAFHVAPASTRALVLDAVAAKAVGALSLGAGLVVYVLALLAFGTSWRLGIDRDRAGELVTGGIFARTRNPIYLGLSLAAWGTFLIQGRLVLLLPAVAFPVYFRHLIRREERFLAPHYGEAYRAYAERVGRWWTWRRRVSGPG